MSRRAYQTAKKPAKYHRPSVGHGLWARRPISGQHYCNQLRRSIRDRLGNGRTDADCVGPSKTYATVPGLLSKSIELLRAELKQLGWRDAMSAESQCLLGLAARVAERCRGPSSSRIPRSESTAATYSKSVSRGRALFTYSAPLAIRFSGDPVRPSRNSLLRRCGAATGARPFPFMDPNQERVDGLAV